MNGWGIPSTQVAGDTMNFAVSVDDYPATDGWTLKYSLAARFTTPTQATITLTGITHEDGVNYRIQASHEETALWAPGFYGWSRWVEKIGGVVTLTSSRDQGELEVLQNPRTMAQGYDSRSHNRKLLAQVQEAQLALRSGGVKSYTIGTRSFTYEDMNDLRTWEGSLKWLVANEDARAAIAAELPNPRKVGISFLR